MIFCVIICSKETKCYKMAKHTRTAFIKTLKPPFCANKSNVGIQSAPDVSKSVPDTSNRSFPLAIAGAWIKSEVPPLVTGSITSLPLDGDGGAGAIGAGADCTGAELALFVVVHGILPAMKTFNFMLHLFLSIH